jgi:glycosyltransferase involved in cell wall biosynthesis
MASEAISLCMIVKDAERELARCLDAVGDLAYEIIVVDTGSTDSTRAIAARRGAKVIPFDFTRIDFAGARNCGVASASGQWILVLDADEALHAESRPLVREIAARGENAGYYFERLNRRAESKNAITDHVVRLFPNRPDYRYRGRVHETVDASILTGGGRLVRTSIRIDHDFAGDPEARRKRNLLYVGILEEEIAADPADYSRLDFLAAEYHQLGMFDKAASIAERLARLRPLDPESHLRAGIYHLLYKVDRARARANFIEALRLRPGYAEAQSFLKSMEEQEREDGQ